MTDENKIIEEKHECLCQKKWFRKFLVIASGTFVGVFLALSLFTALNKPPMPMPCPCGAPCPCQQMMRPDFGPQHFDRGYRKDFHKKFDKRADRPALPREDRAGVDVDD